MKLVKTLMISIVSLLVVGLVAFVAFFYIANEEETDELSLNDMNKYSYETPEMTTDLKSGTFVRIQFRLIADSKKSAKEISQREFQIQNMLIKELAVMSEEDFREGLSDLEDTLRDELNEEMTDGSIKEVYTIDKILQ